MEIPECAGTRDFAEMVADATAGQNGWRVSLTSDGFWVLATPSGNAESSQGWKLHLSASIVNAANLLDRALQCLIAERVQFKVARSRRDLAALNEGESGLSQIGKFVTVYPLDDQQAVRLADLLDRATAGLAGPTVPSDRVLRPGSAVHYRYGGFSGQVVRLPHGEIAPAIQDPEGKLVPDRRGEFYEPQPWMTDDPFVAAGIAAPCPKPTTVIDHRYVVVALLHRSPRGTVHLGLDLEVNRRCIVKQATRGAIVAHDGRDALDQLRHEYDILTTLAPEAGVPAPYALVEKGENMFLIMEDIAGQTLASIVRELHPLGQTVAPSDVIAWGMQIAELLVCVHAHGFIYRDLKPTNIVQTLDGSFRLLDLELAYRIDDSTPPVGIGTRGYMSPQQKAGAVPTVADDVYALGALLHFIATGAEPSQLPITTALADRPVRLLNPAVPAPIAHLIECCLHAQPSLRFSSPSAVRDALRQCMHVATPDSNGPSTPGVKLGTFTEEARRRAYQLGKTIVAEAQDAPGAQDVTWKSGHYASMGFSSRDINTGSGGVVLALAELVGEFGEPEWRSVLRQGAQWLARSSAPKGAHVPGLYVGDMGVAVAILRAAQILGDATLLGAATESAKRIAATSHNSPDLFNGSAGRLRAHLLFFDETHDAEHLSAAVAAGDALVSKAIVANQEGKWRIPQGFDGLSDREHLGYAHGAAGIADALLDLYETVPDPTYIELARSAGRWIARQSLCALNDGSGAEWPVTEGGQPVGAMWCHGSCGIARFLLHASKFDCLDGAFDLACRAARTVAFGARSLGPTQCHGLAGSIELLFDFHLHSGECHFLEEAYELAQIMEGFAVEREGRLRWCSDRGDITAPDYMVGYAGVAVCMLRLAQPERPTQISRAGFRWHSHPKVKA